MTGTSNRQFTIYEIVRRQAVVIRVQWGVLAALAVVAIVLACIPHTRETSSESSATQAPAPTVAATAQVAAPSTSEPATTATATPCPISEDEVVMLAKTIFAEANVCSWNGEQYGVSAKARQAAVAWVALNRLDTGTYGNTLAEVLTAPNQFAYDADTEATEYMLDLAEDVVERWWAEKQGAENVGRTIPADYLFFHGNGRENFFRKEYKGSGDYWNWSLADPY